MTDTTVEDMINAAASIATDAAEGRLDPATLEQQLVTELQALVGTVVGPEDPLWPIQTDVARQVVSRGGIEANELSEWAAVAHRRENPDTEPLSPTVPIGGADTPPEVSSSGSGELSPENGSADDDLDGVPREVLAEAERAALAVIAEWREANR